MEVLRKSRGAFRAVFTRASTKLQDHMNSEVPELRELMCLLQVLEERYRGLKTLDESVYQKLLETDASEEELVNEVIMADEYLKTYLKLKANVNAFSVDVREGSQGKHQNKGPEAVNTLLESVDKALKHAVEVKENIPLDDMITNFEEVSQEGKAKLIDLEHTPNRMENPVIYHLDVGPNIILTRWREQLIGLGKNNLLRRILGRASLMSEEMTTILCDCEAVLNARALALFLHGQCSTGALNMDENETSHNSRFRYRVKVVANLRKRFCSEYLGLSLQRLSPPKIRHKLQVGGRCAGWTRRRKKDRRTLERVTEHCFWC